MCLPLNRSSPTNPSLCWTARSTFSTLRHSTACACLATRASKLWRDSCWRGCNAYLTSGSPLSMKAIDTPSQKWKAIASQERRSKNWSPQKIKQVPPTRQEIDRLIFVDIGCCFSQKRIELCSTGRRVRLHSRQPRAAVPTYFVFYINGPSDNPTRALHPTGNLAGGKPGLSVDPPRSRRSDPADAGRRGAGRRYPGHPSSLWTRRAARRPISELLEGDSPRRYGAVVSL